MRCESQTEAPVSTVRAVDSCLRRNDKWCAGAGARVPHEVALEIMRGKRPILVFREHPGMTLRELSEKTGIATGYISEIERGLKSGSASALARIARALGTTIDVLVDE